MDKSIEIKSNRNSLIELMRFLASLWVLFFHDMLFIAKHDVNGFGGGKLSVDFFFILSGLFFVKSFNKYKDGKIIESFISFSAKRIKSMGSALIIGLLFSTLYFIVFPDFSAGSTYCFGFLWYIPMLFLGFFFYFVILKKVKDVRMQNIIVFMTTVVAFFLYFVFDELRFFSPFGGIGFGIIVSRLPLLSFMKKHSIIPISLTCLIMLVSIYCAYLPKNGLLIDYLMIFVLFSTFLYLCLHFNMNIKLFDFLGKISFGLYAMQTIPRVLRDCNIITNNITIFFIIVALSLVCLFLDKKVVNKRVLN